MKGEAVRRDCAVIWCKGYQEHRCNGDPMMSSGYSERSSTQAIQHCFHQAKHPTLLALEAAVVEIQSAAVFGDDAYDLLRCAVRDVDFNLQGQPDVGSHHPG